ncbi:hypothetical protein C0J45_20606 [Silurus meridionalis]|nr:hypothetical protein C0J45_20606 [Silurus meridionalis]
MIETIKREKEEEEEEDREGGEQEEGEEEEEIWHGHGASCLPVRVKEARLHATSRPTMIRFHGGKRPGVYGHIRIGETKNRFA